MALLRPLSLSLALCLGCNKPRPPAAIADAAPTELAPPQRPANVLARATLARPTATAEALGRAADTRIPVELTLALALGVDVSVLSAIDAARPIDVTLTGDLTSPRWTVAFTPASAARARSALSPRYRFVTVADLGDRLEPKGESGLSDSAHRMPCALIAVPSEITSRVVCALDEETLRAAGRWTAFESARSTDVSTDLRLLVEREALRTSVVPTVAARIRAVQQALAADASAARREHDRPPDVGDPEAAVALLGDVAGEVERAGAECERAELSVQVNPSDVTLHANAIFQPNGTSTLVVDAASRIGAASGHPLATRLPPDAVLMTASRAAPGARVEALHRLVATALGVLGQRVVTEAARGDLDALLAHTGEETALAFAHDAPDGMELTLLFSQTDAGAGARAVLTRMLRAPWLRAVRLGSALRVTALARGGVQLQLTPTAAPSAAPRPPELSLAMGVRANVLGVVLGRHAPASLDAIELRASPTMPGLMTGTEAHSLGGGLYFGRREAQGEPVRWNYRATRTSEGLRAEGELRLPNAALPLLRDAVSGFIP